MQVDNYLAFLHNVKGFNFIDASNDDCLLVHLDGGKVMRFEMVYDEDFEMDLFMYFDVETDCGLETFDINDILTFEVV
ncbi:hypothetical protein HPMBJEAJ_00111 [Aeromonas phage avDM6]|nr:hypothetical protein HPMBJEAJ_00111 [Aeromonas phage avDM6]